MDARVNNNAANVAGERMTNTVIVSAADPDTPGNRTETRASVDVEMAEPDLDIVKTATPVTAYVADTVRYTIDYLDPGETVKIIFDVTIHADVDTGELLDNTATVDDSTLDGPGLTPADPWDRVGDDSGDERLTIASPTISKSIIATSNADTAQSRHNGSRMDVAVSEEITDKIRVACRKATAQISASPTCSRMLPVAEMAR